MSHILQTEKAATALSAAQGGPYAKKEPQFLWGSDLLAETEGFEPSIRLLTV